MKKEPKGRGLTINIRTCNLMCVEKKRNVEKSGNENKLIEEKIFKWFIEFAG